MSFFFTFLFPTCRIRKKGTAIPDCAPDFNGRFALDYTRFESVMEESPAADVINRTLAVCALRKFDSGSAVSYKNQLYQALNEDGQLVCFKNHTECLVIVAFDKTMYVMVDDNVYLLSPTVRNHKVSKNFDQEIEKHKPRKKYIPPMTHPWKAASFRRQQQRAHHHGCYA